MLSVEFCIQTILLLFLISWVVAMMAIVKLIGYFRKFEAFKERNDIELNIIAGYMKKIHEQMIFTTNEIKRSNRLMSTLTKGLKIVETSQVNFVDDGIYRDIRHDDIKIELESQTQTNLDVTAVETQPIPEKKRNDTSQSST